MVRQADRLMRFATCFLNELNGLYYPATVACLKQLKEALVSEFGAAQTARRKRRRRGPEEQADRHKLTKKLRWQASKRQQLEEEIKTLKTSSHGGVLRMEWLHHLFL